MLDHNERHNELAKKMRIFDQPDDASEARKPAESENFIPSLSLIENFDDTAKSLGWMAFHNYFLIEFDKIDD